MATMKVEILSPDRPICECTASGVMVPGSLGYLTILPDHAALVAELDIGEIRVDGDKQGQRFFVSGGYLEVVDNKLTILADVVESSSEIDRARARKAKDRATERLEKKVIGLDSMRAQAALKRAESRIMIAGSS